MLKIPPVPLLKTNEPPSGNIMAVLRAGKQTTRKRPLLLNNSFFLTLLAKSFWTCLCK